MPVACGQRAEDSDVPAGADSHGRRCASEDKRNTQRNDRITVAETEQRNFDPIAFTNKASCSALARRWLSGFVLLGTVVFVAPGVSAQTAGVTNRPILFYIPHTHWEGAVFKTREDYLEMGLPHILKALQLLKQHPDYKFTLDQVAYFKPFLERYPEEAAGVSEFC